MSGVRQARGFRLETKDPMLMRQLVPCRGMAQQLAAGRDQAIMKFGNVGPSLWPPADSVRIALIARVLFGFGSGVIIVRVKKNVLLRTWMIKDEALLWHDFGYVTWYLTFTKHTTRLGLTHGYQK